MSYTFTVHPRVVPEYNGTYVIVLVVKDENGETVNKFNHLYGPKDALDKIVAGEMTEIEYLASLGKKS